MKCIVRFMLAHGQSGLKNKSTQHWCMCCPCAPQFTCVPGPRALRKNLQNIGAYVVCSPTHHKLAHAFRGDAWTQLQDDVRLQHLPAAALHTVSGPSDCQQLQCESAAAA
eukprot:1153509-Pelagomonas_calceolata.AAC.4